MRDNRVRRTIMGAVAVTAAVAGVAVPGVSFADEARANNPHCDYVAEEPVRIRAEPTVDSTGLALLNVGDRIDCDSKAQVGGKYTDCGGGDVWNSVIYLDRRAWVASTCVRWEPA